MGDRDARATLRKVGQCPLPVEYLLELYRDLEMWRTYGEHGPDGFSPERIDAWARLRGHRLTPNDVHALHLMDVATRFPDPTPTAGGRDDAADV